MARLWVNFTDWVERGDIGYFGGLVFALLFLGVLIVSWHFLARWQEKRKARIQRQQNLIPVCQITGKKTYKGLNCWTMTPDGNIVQGTGEVD